MSYNSIHRWRRVQLVRYSNIALCNIKINGSPGFSACLPLYGLSFFCKDIVGFIYANEDATKIKIAYLDFWGKRVDIIVDTNDIIPFSEQPQSLLAAFYVNLCRYSTKDKLKVNLRFGRILDNDRFMQIFSKPAYY